MIDPFLPAVQQADLVRKRQVHPRELVETYLRRIETYNAALNAFWLVTPELALEQADQMDSGSQGRLAGVPVSIKDLVALSGYPTTYGSRAFDGVTTNYDQFPVARIKEGGCPILGKTTTPEFGARAVTEFGLHGVARNPWDLSRSSGGSSGGAAAALAAGLCAWSHGTDGSGSTRIPAACCGLVGLKPARGRISRGPIQGEAWAGLATDGVLARTVADAAAGLDVMAGHLPGDPYWADLDGSFLDAATPPRRPLRVAFTTAASVPVHAEVRAAVENVAGVAHAAGHQVEEAAPATSVFRALQKVAIVTAIASWEVADVSVLDPVNRHALELSRALTASDYYKALNAIWAHSRKVIAFWDDYDVLVTPTLTEPAPEHGRFSNPLTARDESLDWLSFTYPYNCTGQPALTLPLAVTSDGLPIGVQLVGPPRGEAVILSLASQFEQTLPWVQRQPPDFA